MSTTAENGRKRAKLSEQIMECASCHVIFSGLTNFDAHRTGPHIKGERKCLAPEEMGLVFKEDRGYWSSPPMTDEQKAKIGWVKQ